MLTADRGATWNAVQGLPEGTRPIADRVNPKRFYAVDFAAGHLLASSDGGRTFTALATQGLPSNTAADTPDWTGASWPLQASPQDEGDLYYFGHAGLFHSQDGGRSFTQVQTPLQIDALSFGKAAPAHDAPALFAIGSMNNLRAIWRSDDSGQTWVRLNDDQHEWGRRFRCICGDPRIFGRVYVGTDGRAILYGDLKKG